MTTEVSAHGRGRPKLLPSEILEPDYDYTAPLDRLDQVPDRKTLISMYTPAQRRSRFIHALHWGHTATWSCRYAGIDYSDAYGWKADYPDSFGSLWETAKETAGGDIWEDRLHAISQSDKHLGAAVTATIVGLKMRKRFIENAPVGNQPVQVQIINVMRGEQTSETVRIDNVPVRDNVRALMPGAEPDTDTPD